MPRWEVLSDVDCPECLSDLLDNPDVAIALGTEAVASWLHGVHQIACIAVTANDERAKVAQR